MTDYVTRLDADRAAVVAAAQALLTDEVRADAKQWKRYVHPDFFQYGFGGSEVRFEDLDEHLQPLKGGVTMEIVSVDRLDQHVILLLWKGHNKHGVVNRAAVWVRTQSGWQLRYQQGTSPR